MIKDKNIDPGAASSMFSVQLMYQPALTNGVANTVVQSAWTATFSGKITAATSFCTAIAATATLDIFKGSNTMLSAPVTPVANTNTDMISSFSTISFNTGDVISLRIVTTGGSGAITGAQVCLCMRPLLGKEVFGY